MAIKAIGVIKENSGNGKRVEVKWQKIDPIREWYFYTYQRTLWKVTPGEWKNDALIDFTFNNQPQDIDRFRNDPFWLDLKSALKMELNLANSASTGNLLTVFLFPQIFSISSFQCFSFSPLRDIRTEEFSRLVSRSFIKPRFLKIFSCK